MLTAPASASGKLLANTATSSARLPAALSDTPRAVFSGTPSRVTPASSASPVGLAAVTRSSSASATTNTVAPAANPRPVRTAPLEL